MDSNDARIRRAAAEYEAAKAVKELKALVCEENKKILGIEYDPDKDNSISLWLVDKIYPDSYLRRRAVLKSLYGQREEEGPLSDEDLELLIRTSYRIVPRDRWQEKYTIDEVVEAATKERRHLCKKVKGPPSRANNRKRNQGLCLPAPL